ncbi:beta-N-acetylglucosaminidase domain-containing protein [Nonomuraea sp. NBC_01738]|uniref:beta-N-acetylglucosaminidase domain-containing protein n=1 Tax=Nonomuraea sp. NBC_01738 TaxID=2976003 RepID=UPI002E0E6E39|nr:beta-N-acetylglucosaminidase domain-containing protein [Nonomuraea sp. NBC_01738]
MHPSRPLAIALAAALLITTPAHAATKAISPAPAAQQVKARPDGFPINPVVGLVRTTDSDDAIEAHVRQTLADAGVKRVVATDGADPGTPVTVYLGDGDAALAGLGVRDAGDLPAEGYVLAAGHSRGHKVIVLDGADADGTYYAALTLRQLVRSRQGADRMPGVEVRDWPTMRYRGSIEGFYGTPWSHQDRLDHLSYLGAHKMNTYEYAPKDDPYHRDRWREPYPADKLAQLGELITRARENRVDFTFALSPGLSICYTNPQDVAALLAKFDAVYGLGGRAFNIPMDDIDAGRWNCEGDRAKYGNPGGAGAGRAQSDVINAAQAWATAKGDVAPLQMVPTEYYNTTETPYKKALREVLDQRVVVQWTGIGVVPATITKAQAADARRVFGHEILVWDNYPVNDYNPGRLTIADYAGREPGLSEQLAGIISNPMNQAAVSKIALYSFADFGWNDLVYDARASWLRALDEVAGGSATVAAALRDFADVNTYDGTVHRQQAPALAAVIAQDDQAGLRAHAERLAAAPGVIRAGVRDQAFLDEAKSWLDATELWAKAMLKALDVRDAVRAGDGAAGVEARQEALGLITAAKAIRDPRAPHSATFPRIGDGVLDRFITRALSELDRWIGVVDDRPAATSTLGTYADNSPDRMADGDTGTFYWSDDSPGAGDAVTVDLGAVKTIGDVAVLMGKPGSPSDFIHAGVLEFSADGAVWTSLATGATAEVKATAPAGAKARYVRYRATAGNDYWLVVREFQVATAGDDVTRLTVSGTPAGTNPAGAADGNLATAWTASAAPAAGDALQVTLSKARLIDKVVVVGSGEAEVQVRAAGQWQPIGRLAGPYTELDLADVSGDAVRLAWTAGSAAPKIADIVPRYADVPAAVLSADPASVDTSIGTQETITLGVTGQRAADVTGTLSVRGPAGWKVPADRQVTLPRGGSLTLPVAFTPGGDGTLEIAFAGITLGVPVKAHRPVAAANLAKGKPVTASSVEGGTSFVAANAVDGDTATRWSSAHADGEWLMVDLGAATDVGRVVLRWEASYGKAYRVESSADGLTWKPLAAVADGDGGVDELWFDQPNSTRHLRVQGVKRALTWGYSLWEVEIHAAA